MSTVIHQEVLLKAAPKKIYEALVDSKQFSKVTGGAPTEISNDAGGIFSCFGGMITGRQIELVPNQRIVQAWRAGNWEAGVYSIVKFELKEQDAGTKLLLDHVGFPEGSADHLEAGWKANYLEPLKKYLAYS
jgi:activator of HSP90 ATPase